jgi:tight adherence protein B
VELNYELFSKETRADLERMVSVTQISGGPLSLALDRLATVIGTRAQSISELELAVAGPKASTRLVMSLPILVLLGSGISGIPIFRALSTPSVVWLSLALGFLLFWLGGRWIARVLKRAEPNSSDAGFNLDLLSVALQAGMPLTGASSLVPELEVSELQEMSLGTGIALNQLVADRATALRTEQFNEDRLRIQKASVSVLWPLGLTVLPAFILIAIVPVAGALLQSQ